MPSPVSDAFHGRPHFNLITWLGIYVASTPGVLGGDNSSLKLDLVNEPQPDAFLRIDPQLGGQTRVDEDGFLEGAPELIAEVAATSASYDLHDKQKAYRRNGVKEYLVWRVLDQTIDWFVLRRGKYEPIEPDVSGLLRSKVFPGLWLDPAALMDGDMALVMRRIGEGLACRQHGEFVDHLKKGQEKT